MSVYDFDNQQHGDNQADVDQHQQSSLTTTTTTATSNNRNDDVGGANSGGGSITNNGVHPLTRYNQAESNFLNRNISINTNNSSDISVSMTRPTSKTALLVRQRRAMLEQLSCFICKGYLIDATTIDECMDSFCKSCIVLYLRSHDNCPKCGVLIHKTNPLSSIRSDKVLQDIVYKLVPGLYDDEMKRRRDFYRNILGTPMSSSSGDDDESSGSDDLQHPSLRSEKYGSVSHPKPFYRPTDSIDISIEPQLRNDCTTIYYDNKRQSIITCFTGNLIHRQVSTSFSTVDSHHFKTYLRCPAKLTVAQLKKFIAAKFNVCREDTMHLLYLNESLRDEYSLIDVAYIYDWRGIEHMRMFYIIERDLSKMAINSSNSHEPNEHTGKGTRQSTGTSSQPVKRVCIDPQPTFYEERNNNTIVANSTGRSMRPRTTESSVQDRSVTTQTSQAPILRSNQGTQKPASTTTNNPGRGSNPISNRELVALNTSANNSRLQSAATRSSIQISATDELVRLRNEGRSSRRQMSANNELSTKSILKTNSDRGTTTNHEVNNGKGSSYNAQNHPTKDSGKREKNQYAASAHNPPQIYRLQQQYQQPHNQQSSQPQHYHQQSQQSQPQQQKSQQQPPQQQQPQTQQLQVQPNNHYQPAQQASVRQLIPFVGSSYASTTTCMAGPSKSSLVTLASFTQGHSNHVMATLSSTSAAAATISNSYRNMLGTQTISRDVGRASWPNQSASTMAPSQPSSMTSTATTTSKNSTQSTPQLAFSFGCVTERGIIIRRLNNQSEGDSLSNNLQTGATTMAPQRAISLPSLPAPPNNSNQSRQQQQQQQQQQHQQQQQQQQNTQQINNRPQHSTSTSPLHFHPTHQTSPNQSHMGKGMMRSEGSNINSSDQSSSTNTSSSVTNQSSINDFNRSRHHIKVKPVYKTLVDPTKVKSPNFKKNHTARH